MTNAGPRCLHWGLRGSLSHRCRALEWVLLKVPFTGTQVKGAFTAAGKAVSTGVWPFSRDWLCKLAWMGMQVKGAFTAAREAVSAQMYGPCVVVAQATIS